MRTLLGEKSIPCNIPTATLESHFNKPAVAIDTDHLPGWLDDGTADQPPNTSDELTHPVTPEEVEIQLKRLPWQSSPGPDGVEYRLWKSAPASSHAMAAIFSTCLVNCRFPDAWKRSNTILIHKGGDEMQPSNWRPISLQSTIYKVFAAVMARRLAEWCLTEKKLSPSQKGFLPMEGCAEHSFTMESIIADAKRRRKDLRILWLDLRNAFGSVPHDLLWLMMNKLKVPVQFIEVCKEVYAGSSQRIRCKEGFTNDIQLKVGIKQGCPLSPLLFNIALEALLPVLDRRGVGYKLENGSAGKQLVYADDISILSSSKEEIQDTLRLVKEFTDWSSLAINVRKCGCLSMINSSSRGRYVEPFSPEFGGQRIPALLWEDAYRYLGVEVGRLRPDTATTQLSRQILEVVDTILDSRLADWQKVDAINLFALSKVNYLLSTSILNRTWAAKLDSEVRKRVKKSLRLPVRTLCAFFHLPCGMGGLGLTSIEDSHGPESPQMPGLKGQTCLGCGLGPTASHHYQENRTCP